MSTQHASPPPTFILDFDGTITTQDTITPLSNAAVAHHKSKNGDLPAQQALDHILSSYLADWKDFHSSPPRGIKTSDFSSVQELVTYQQSLQGIEKASFARVSQSGILGGIDRVEWRELARRAIERGDVVIRDGFKAFVRDLQERDGKWGVLSVNFCEAWVRGVLAVVLGDELARDVVVLANVPDEKGVLRSYDGGEVMCTSDGKLRGLRVFVRRLEVAQDETIVYIGDSGTDAECLLEKDVVGIVMVKEDGTSKLVDSLEQIGIQEKLNFKFLRTVRSVRNFDRAQRQINGKRVWFGRDFTDVIESRLFK